MKMTLEQMLKLGEIDAKVSTVREQYVKSPTFNVPFALAVSLGREKEPEFAQIFQSYQDKNPIAQQAYLDRYVNTTAGELITAISSNVSGAVKGLTHEETLARYLLTSPIKPGKYGVSPEWNKSYASAHAAQQALSDEKGLAVIAQKYVATQVESLTKKKVDAGMLDAFKWVYENEPELAIQSVKLDLSTKVGKFLDGFKISDAQKYVSGRFEALKDEEKSIEAYRIGKAVYESAQRIKAEKEAEKARKEAEKVEKAKAKKAA